jgi:hypothetical protein
MTLLEFLTACLDDDERVALAAGGASWSANVPGMVHVDAAAIAANKHAFGKLGYVASVQQDADREHIARWDPARVLADIAAKRFVIETLRGYEPDDEWDTEPDMGRRSNNAAGAVRRLAQQFAGRPGWDEAWRTLGN